MKVSKLFFICTVFKLCKMLLKGLCKMEVYYGYIKEKRIALVNNFLYIVDLS